MTSYPSASSFLLWKWTLLVRLRVFEWHLWPFIPVTVGIHGGKLPQALVAAVSCMEKPVAVTRVPHSLYLPSALARGN